MNWRMKGLTQKALSSLPGGPGLNDLLQRKMGGLRNFTATLEAKLTDWSILMSCLKEVHVHPSRLCLLEIGTGWFPTLPVCFSLAGARSCDTFDLVRHLDSRLTFQMVAGLETHLPRISAATCCPLPEIQDRYAELKSARSTSELLELASLEYHAPADAADTGLPHASRDLVFSNSVLEHVSAEAIHSMMCESYRVLRSGGLAIHSVNCGDHYAYFDQNITLLNYLTYRNSDWQLWNNNLQYQNRLRPVDFVRLTEEAGFRLVLKRQPVNQELLRVLPELKLAPEFQSYPPEDLCCTSFDFIVMKP